MTHSKAVPVSKLQLYLAVAVGGAIGAFVRYTLETLIAPARDGWPTATFVVNLTGCALLGVVLVFARFRYPEPARSRKAAMFRPFVVTGLLGGYTTFSTYVVEIHTLSLSDNWEFAALYAALSIVFGVFLVWLAMNVSEFTFRRAGWTDPFDAEPVGEDEPTIEAEEEA